MKIEVRDLTVRYGATTALDGVGFDVAAGAVFALLGRNGSGKSTLVRALLGQRRPDVGTIRIGGLDPWRQRGLLMARVGATPEVPDAPPDLTVGALERWTAPFHQRWESAAWRARLERFEIPARARFAELSRGQKALVSLALALAPRPELLVLDDPTLGLDAVARRYFFDEMIGELAERGVTVLMTSHDLEGIERIATDVAILQHGRLASCAPVDELREASAGATLEEIVTRIGSGGAR